MIFYNCILDDKLNDTALDGLSEDESWKLRYVLEKLGLFSNRTGTWFDDGKAREND